MSNTAETKALPPIPNFTDDDPPPPDPKQRNGDDRPPLRSPQFVEEPKAAPPSDIDNLRRWMVQTLDQALPEILRKADEYGSGDLEMMGSRLQRMLRLPAPSVGQQASAAFYADGKVARIMAALEEGREPSADCWFDLMVYGMIGLKLHQTGQWL